MFRFSSPPGSGTHPGQPQGARASSPGSLSGRSSSFTFTVRTPTFSETGSSDAPQKGRLDLPFRQTGASSASTAGRFFQGFTAGPTSRGGAHDSPESHTERAPSSGALPATTPSTYADLYNATPTPRTRLVRPTPGLDSLSRSPQVPSSTRRLSGHLNNLGAIENEGASNAYGDGHEGPSTMAAQENNRPETLPEQEQDSENSHFYNLRQEQLPRARIYDERLQNILRDTRDRLTELQDALRVCPLIHDQGSDISELYRQLEILNHFEYPETRTVGFIGDSGTGKSSLINSLLDQGGLARSSGDGAACTCVVTEFRNVDTDHPQPFTVEADFMNEEEIQELLEELVRSFRLYNTDAFREVKEVQEQQRIRETSTRAWETLRSLFRNQAELTQEFLSDERDGAESAILENLKEWAMAVLDNRPGGANALRFSVVTDDLNACRYQLDALTTDPQDEHVPALWPFIKLIRVYLRSPILRTGLILTDVPGFRDLNFARVRATERYLRHSCDEVFIVTTISRCITDQSITDIKQRCDPEQPLRIVCTRSEDVNADETSRNCSANVARQIQEFQTEIRGLRSRINETRLRKNREVGEQQIRYAAEESRLRDQMESEQLRLLSFLIMRRNREVTRELNEKYTDTVKIFPVSNRLYTDHRDDSPDTVEAYIALSGIRQLRQYCQLVPAEAQFRAAAQFLEHKTPAFLASLNQWALGGADQVTAQRARTLRQMLRELQDMLEQVLTSRQSIVYRLQEDLNLQFTRLIADTVRNHRHRWKDSAIQASRDWSGWSPQTYAAFCRHYGTHKTEAVGPRCWNNEILQYMREELDHRWDSIENWIESQEDELRGIIRDLFETACNMFQAHLDLAPQALGNILESARLSEGCIVDVINGSMSRLLQGTIGIRTDFLGGHDSSCLAGLMRHAYGACRQESGRGSDQRRKDIIHRHLSHPAEPIFTNFREQLARDHRDMVNTTCQDLQRGVREEMGRITRDIRAVVVEEGQVAEAGQFPVVSRQLQEMVRETRRVLDNAQRIIQELSNVRM